jgi:uncharacterized protein (DUF2336 family)
MTEVASSALIADLEGAVAGGSSQRRIDMLRKVTDLFLSDADRLNEQQIEVFDDVLVRLMARVEARTLEKLSSTLSDVQSAPRDVVRRLAFHEEASVAAPVLSKSRRISDADLIEIAKTRGQQHLLAISVRETLNAAITDVLIDRGDAGVSRALAGNAGARFSETGYATLVEHAGRDDGLAERLGLRLDIPVNLLRELLRKATAAVRARLLQAAPPEVREKIKAAIESVTEHLGLSAPKPVDYTVAQAAVLALNRAGNLSDSAVNRFALERQYDHVGAALSLLSSVAIEAIDPLVTNSRPDGLIVACRAARLSWSTTMMILRNRSTAPAISKLQLEQGKEVFDTLSLSAAQRTIRFWSARNSAKKSEASDAPVAMAGG